MKVKLISLLAILILFSLNKGICEENVFNLGEIVVTATKTEHILADVPAEVSVITEEEIKRRNIKTVQDALKYITGIKINKNCGSWGDKGKVEIFGLDSKHVLILVDGQRILGGHAASVDLQQIPVEAVERIEIVKGPSSALYGSDAIGGVINIITKSAPEKSSFSISISSGSRGTQIYELSGGFKKGKFGSFLSYTYRTSEGIEEELDKYWENIFQGSLEYEFNPHLKFKLKPYYSYHKMKHEGRTQERTGINSILEWLPDELSKLKFRNSFFNYKHWTDDKSSNWHHNSYETEIDYTRFIREIHTLTGGYHYHKEDVDDKGKNYKADQYLHSFFIQDEMDFSPFIFVLGTRIDNHDRWGTEVNPKASFLYKISKNLKLRASIGRAFRGPTLVKLYADNWRMGPYIVHANPDLKPEKSIGYQFGAEYIFSEKLLCKLSYFRNELEDLISYRIVRMGPPPWDLYWENVKEAMTQGIEFSLTSKIMENLTGKFGYTFLDTEDKSTGKELTYRPEHKINIEFDWIIPKIGINLNLEGEYIGKRYDSDYKRLGGYTIFNLSLSKDIGKYTSIFARIDNISGRKNIPDEYDIDGTVFLFGIKGKF